MRLTKYMKEIMIKDICQKQFEEKMNKWEAWEKELSMKIYHNIMGEHLQTIKLLPENFFVSSSRFKVRLNSGHGFKGIGTIELTLPTSMAMPEFLRYGYELDLPKEHPLVIELVQFKMSFERLHDQRDTLKDALKKAIDSIPTDKQLLKLFPEAAPFLKVFQKNEATNEVALSFVAIRTLLKDK